MCTPWDVPANQNKFSEWADPSSAEQPRGSNSIPRLRHSPHPTPSEYPLFKVESPFILVQNNIQEMSGRERACSHLCFTHRLGAATGWFWPHPRAPHPYPGSVGGMIDNGTGQSHPAKNSLWLPISDLRQV